MDNERKPFAVWAIVEVMGHQRFAGRVTEEVIAGHPQLRVDIPATAKWPEHTKYFGGGSIYALHPCSEEIARQAAERMAASYGYAPIPVAIPAVNEHLRNAQLQLAGTSEARDRDFDIDEDGEDELYI